MKWEMEYRPYLLANRPKPIMFDLIEVKNPDEVLQTL